MVKYYADNTDLRNGKTKDYSHCINESFASTILKCNFEKRLNYCDAKKFQNFKQNTNSYFYIADWEYLSEEIDNIFRVYGNLCFSIISLLFCALVLAILSHTKPAKESKLMYSLIKTFTVFNIIFIIVNSLKPLGECFNMFHQCGQFRRNEYTTYFNFGIKFIGRTFKSASNLTHIAFIASRYLIIAKSKSNILKKISIKFFIFITLFLSFCLNIPLFFLYSFELPIFGVTGPSEIYENQNFSYDYKENFTPLEYIIVNIFQYINIILSDLSYILVSFIIDVILIVFLKKQAKKSQSIGRVVQVNNAPATRAKKKESIRKRLTWIIVLNSFNFIIFRLPLAILSFYGFYFYYDSRTKEYQPNLSSYIVCRVFLFCLNVEEFLYAFYLISFIVQFVIFIRFDSNIREGFANLRKKLKNKLTCRR